MKLYLLLQDLLKELFPKIKDEDIENCFGGGVVCRECA